jgi:hypothetical protein
MRKAGPPVAAAAIVATARIRKTILTDKGEICAGRGKLPERLVAVAADAPPVSADLGRAPPLRQIAVIGRAGGRATGSGGRRHRVGKINWGELWPRLAC